MAPCVVVGRLEGKQRCSRAEVSEHAGIQARKWSSWLFTKKREVNEKNDQTLNNPHTITTARRIDNIPLICTGAGLIHPVHSQPTLLATEAMPRNEVTFLPFSRRSGKINVPTTSFLALDSLYTISLEFPNQCVESKLWYSDDSTSWGNCICFPFFCWWSPGHFHTWFFSGWDSC